MLKICENCNKKFNGNYKAKFCNECKTIKINCDYCGKEYDLLRKYINKENHFCSNICQLNYIHNKKSGPGKCSKCGKFNNSRSAAGIGKECGCLNKHLLNDNLEIQRQRNHKAVKINKQPGNCTICGKYVYNRNIYGVCKKCSDIKQKQHLENNKSAGNCIICGIFANIRDTFGRCENCAPIYKRDENNKIIFIGSKTWEQYSKIIKQQVSLNFEKLGFKRILFDESKKFEGYPTLAWEQRFADICEYPWVVYIKYYLDEEGNSKPLVVGKTGTQKVNSYGSDIHFNYIDKNNGPARQFLYENNLKWDKSFIDFKCFKTEKEAYEFERKMLDNKNYILFGS